MPLLTATEYLTPINLEKSLSNLHGRDSALVFTSAYSANQTTIWTICNAFKNICVFSDELNHASLIQGIKNSKSECKIFKHNNLEHLEKLLKDSEKIKILASNTSEKKKNYFNDIISLPVKISDLNQIVENSVIKKNFNKNSSILIKQYKLDKNEKKLIKDKNYVLLTEKEIQLLELFLDNKKPVSKNKILKEVWKYSTSADTHTVETHIYRLRKKIKSKFLDENFILNNKDGYLL